MSDFSAINTALTGLLAQQDALNTVGQNVANANTAGYTRERVDMTGIGGSTVPAMYATQPLAGGGVKVLDISRISDRFLELRSLQEHSADSNLSQTQSVLQQVQASFQEPGPNGIQAQLSEFWSDWDSVANNPADSAARTQLLDQAATVAGSFNQVAGQITTLRQSSTANVSTVLAQVNAAAQTIAQLNTAISSAAQSGNSANNLIDQRNQLVDTLAKDIGATVSDGPNGTVNVFVGNNALVRGSLASSLHVVTDQNSGNVSIHWNQDNSDAQVSGGTIGGLITAVNGTLPGYLSQLDAVAQNLRNTVNAQHRAGVSLGSAPSTTASNLDFFTGTGAADLAVSPTLTPDQIAAAKVSNGATPPDGGPGDGSNASAMAELANSPSGPDAQYRNFIDGLGVALQQVDTQVSMQSSISQQVDSSLKSVEGVNTDEEMANMVSFQHAYEAAARFMTAIDSTLDTLINNTGLVGR